MHGKRLHRLVLIHVERTSEYFVEGKRVVSVSWRNYLSGVRTRERLVLIHVERTSEYYIEGKRVVSVSWRNHVQKNLEYGVVSM